MYKEDLFKLIRSEEVIIWAGAGLSHYAGYPSGSELAEILYRNLTDEEKKQIDPNLPLPELAEQFYRIKGNSRNHLLKILTRTYIDFIPKSTTFHDILATIPHFKTVITTNYDRLIENAFKQKGIAVVNPTQIPYIDKNKVHIFKVHGDVSEPESIIITSSDYNTFFKENSENNFIWTVVKERLLTKSVLFLGYNLEDPNVSVIFDRISESLAVHRNPCFMIAPDLSQVKSDFLCRKGINYINGKAEDFIEELITNIKDNINSDLEQKLISAETFKDFFLNHKLSPVLKVDKDSFRLSSIRGLDEESQGTMKLTLKNDKELLSEFNDFLFAKKVGKFEIPAEKLIKAEFRMSGIKLPYGEGITKLEFQHLPRITTNFDIKFDNGFELTDIPVKLFGSISEIVIQIFLKNADLTLELQIDRIPDVKFNFSYLHHELFTKTKDEIDLFSMLKNLWSGQHFVVYAAKGQSFSHCFPQLDSGLAHAERFFGHFENLKFIENHISNIRFTNIVFNSITENDVKLASEAVFAIKEELQIQNWDDEITITLSNHKEETLKQLVQLNETNTQLVFQKYKDEEVDVHGYKINLGYKRIEILDPYVINLKQILKKQEKIVRINSKSKKVIISYSKTKEKEPPIKI